MWSPLLPGGRGCVPAASRALMVMGHRPRPSGPTRPPSAAAARPWARQRAFFWEGFEGPEAHMPLDVQKDRNELLDELTKIIRAMTLPCEATNLADLYQQFLAVRAPHDEIQTTMQRLGDKWKDQTLNWTPEAIATIYRVHHELNCYHLQSFGNLGVEAAKMGADAFGPREVTAFLTVCGPARPASCPCSGPPPKERCDAAACRGCSQEDALRHTAHGAGHAVQDSCEERRGRS